MNKENCALNLVDEIILYYDARSNKRQKTCITYCTCRQHSLLPEDGYGLQPKHVEALKPIVLLVRNKPVRIGP